MEQKDLKQCGKEGCTCKVCVCKPKESSSCKSKESNRSCSKK
ncbi:hypothetical protein [[Mycoplasma] mobile]|nr:hypothetical protein [[Mycoplasma] mobile]